MFELFIILGSRSWAGSPGLVGRLHLQPSIFTERNVGDPHPLHGPPGGQWSQWGEVDQEIIISDLQAGTFIAWELETLPASDGAHFGPGSELQRLSVSGLESGVSWE